MTQFKTNEALYKVVEQVITLPENRWENDAWDLSDAIADDDLPEANVITLDIHEKWLNNHFPVKIKSFDIPQMPLADRFVYLQRAQLYMQHKYDAKTMQQFFVSSDLQVTETDIETVDFFKSRLNEPLVCIDIITHVINKKIVKDDAVLLDLMLLRWFIWKMIRK